MTSTEGFVHPALLYRGAGDYLAGTVPFIQAGLAAGEPVMVAVPGQNLAQIRSALGADSGRVQLHDMSVAGRNPGRILPAVLLAFAAAHPQQRVRIVGEPIWAGRTEVEYPACAQHEALINAAFADRAATILCPYDLTSLDQNAVDDAYRTHPVLLTATERWDSPHYDDPFAVAATFNLPLPPAPSDAATIAIELKTLGEVRHLVSALATGYGMTADRIVDLVIAVNEVASNTVEHTLNTGTLAVWRENGTMVCQLNDSGHIADPLAGRLPVPPDIPEGGRGLVMVNYLCDLVRIHTGPDGTTIRLHMHLA